MLLDKLLESEYKGQKFLVRDSSITFGQKTIRHEYPNSDRSEVEFLGESAETFTLNIVITGKETEYKQKRDNFIRVLKQPGKGILVHPIDGSIEVVVLGQPTITENLQGDLGKAEFSVTFMRYFESIYPTESLDNIPKITNSAQKVLDNTQSNIEEKLNTGSAIIYDNTKDKLESFIDHYKESLTIASQLQKYVSKTQEKIAKFETDLYSIVSDPTNLALQVKELFESVDLSYESKIDQLNVWKNIFGFDTDDRTADLQDTWNIVRSRENNNIINNAVKFCSLALGYKTASLISYQNTDELDEITSQLQLQYDEIISNDDLDNDVRLSIQNLRNEFRIFSDQQRETISQVYNTTIANETSITVLSYSYYGNTDYSQNIVDLNKFRESRFIEGDIKILTEV